MEYVERGRINLRRRLIQGNRPPLEAELRQRLRTHEEDVDNRVGYPCRGGQKLRI